MQNAYARVYGLTGVIGSGKSTATQLFKELGATVLDADEIARYVVNPTAPYYAGIRDRITQLFGGLTQGSLFLPNGELNRARLGSVVFGDDQKVRMLNEIMHPCIQQEFAARVNRVDKNSLLIYDVPLLFETGLDKLVKATILVYAPEEVCMQRALERANQKGEKLNADAIYARLRSQISIEKKRERADYIIDNSGTLESLKDQVERVYQKLVQL
ncbi:MAG TPA: dephospho-CoA kinase [Turneriella sp.]|nr:dephospho-CoA kinase [Turneriella sp.]